MIGYYTEIYSIIGMHFDRLHYDRAYFLSLANSAVLLQEILQHDCYDHREGKEN